MAYSDFSLKEVINKFELKLVEEYLFAKSIKNKLIKQNEFLKTSISRGLNTPLNSEKARSEALVYPILVEIQERNNREFLVHSGENLDIDKNLGLNGECDFIISKGVKLITSPIICIVEAKKHDIDLGLGQCTAQMIGSQIFNQQNKSQTKIIYGIVTTGKEWQFLKLNEKILTIDLDDYFIDQIDKILTILQLIFDENKTSVSVP